MTNNEFEEYGQLIRKSISDAIAVKGKSELAVAMFDQFFAIYPETRNYFNETDIQSFAPNKFDYLTNFFIDTVDSPSFAEQHVAHEVDRHLNYDVKDPEYYFTLIEVFKDVILGALQGSSTEELEAAWSDVAMAMKSYIQEGAKEYL